MTGFPGIVIAQTAAVGTGTYYVSASTLISVGSDDLALCYTTTVNIGGMHTVGGSGLYGGYQQASTTDVWFVGEGDAFQLVCYDNNANSSVQSGSITAILIIARPTPSPNMHRRFRLRVLRRTE